ncbi:MULTISPECIES: class I adenylate-forming enzyme family protein [unclassified Streptomyces]|uniref:class I adenylate-forming enzyme family protein n=1 Tax=unclassified Streptomyces TaxID=2593676 RepID=UPI002E2B60AF|nr:class I adenylate-forming enzyme family protein [Streptomyces sp. NBC_00223]
MGASRPTNIGLVFDRHAEARRQTVMLLDRPFDIAPDGGTRYDGAALADLVHQASNWLYAAGLRRGQKVGIVKDNHFDMLILTAAAARIGALPAELAPLASLASVQGMLRNLRPDLLVASTTMLQRAAKAGTTLAEPGIRTIAVPSLDPTAPEAPEGTIPLSDLLGSPTAPVNFRPDDEPMIITHSSGTTGVPKLVVNSGSTILGAGARMETIRFPVVASRRTDVVGTSFTYAHARSVSWTAGQLTLAPTALSIISDPSLDNAARALAEHRPTTLEACPNIFQRWEELADNRPELFEQVRLYVGTFDAVHPRTVRKFLGASKTKHPIWGQSWGQSEVGPVCAAFFTRRSIAKTDKPTSVTNDIGWTVPFLAKVRVVDPLTGRRQPRGKPGILMVSTRARCITYLGEEDRHTEKVDGEWWNTGDVGTRGWLGRMRLEDREVDTIPGGSSIELESVLLDRLERAIDVTLLGVPDQDPIPVLCMRDNELDPADWKRATEDLPPLAEPLLVPWEQVPRTATWKVRRLELREQLLGTSAAVGTGRWT